MITSLHIEHHSSGLFKIGGGRRALALLMYVVLIAALVGICTVTKIGDRYANILDVLNLLKKYDIYIHVGKRLWDIELAAIEIDNMYRLVYLIARNMHKSSWS